jgi:very-short-patch-repair endonuclease
MRVPNTTPQWIVELKVRLRQEKLAAKKKAPKPPKKTNKKQRRKQRRERVSSNCVDKYESCRSVLPEIHSTQLAKDRAEELKKRLTKAEIVLAEVLDEVLPRFRATVKMQFPIGQYIADFFIPEIRVVIEVDGGYHNDRVEEDKRRTRHLLKIGVLKVVRFKNEEVFGKIVSVTEKITALFGTAFTVNMIDDGKLEQRPYYFPRSKNQKREESK